MGRTIEMIVERFKDLVYEYWNSSSEETVRLREEIEDAKKDWICAQNYFQNVTDPDLIDHAIYMLEAAEAKYTYLLKQARNSMIR
ncbi:YaaL family protein [Anoxybacter fermentans]|nr:YaaL family protein [Anoxybacter fermentans]